MSFPENEPVSSDAVETAEAIIRESGLAAYIASNIDSARAHGAARERLDLQTGATRSNDTRGPELRAADAEAALIALIHECWNIDAVRHSDAMRKARSCFPGNPEYFARNPIA